MLLRVVEFSRVFACFVRYFGVVLAPRVLGSSSILACFSVLLRVVEFSRVFACFVRYFGVVLAPLVLESSLVLKCFSVF